MASKGSTITAQLEKVFFHWILKNPHFIKVTEGNYFKNEDIKFIYNVIREEWFLSTDKIVPSNKEIKTLIRNRSSVT